MLSTVRPSFKVWAYEYRLDGISGDANFELDYKEHSITNELFEVLMRIALLARRRPRLRTSRT